MERRILQAAVMGGCLLCMTAAAVAGENEEAIRKALGEKTEMEFVETPLNIVVEYFKDRHKFEAQFDFPRLREAGIDPSTTGVTRTLRGTSLRSALNMLLDDLELVWVIENEVMLITTKKHAKTLLKTRVYDVRDLVVDEGNPKSEPDFDTLIETITATISVNTWEELGGTGSIRAIDKNGIRALVVLQTDAGHEAIEKLLADLRKVKPEGRSKQ